MMWRTTESGVLVLVQHRPPAPSKPAAPCPPAIREKLRQLRAEFAARVGR